MEESNSCLAFCLWRGIAVWGENVLRAGRVVLTSNMSREERATGTEALDRRAFEYIIYIC